MFDIDKEKWTLDLREGTRAVSKGAPADKPDLTLTVSDDNFVKLVNGKLGPQQVCQGSALSCLFNRLLRMHPVCRVMSS